MRLPALLFTTSLMLVASAAFAEDMKGPPVNHAPQGTPSGQHAGAPPPGDDHGPRPLPPGQAPGEKHEGATGSHDSDHRPPPPPPGDAKGEHHEGPPGQGPDGHRPPPPPPEGKGPGGKAGPDGHRPPPPPPPGDDEDEGEE